MVSNAHSKARVLIRDKGDNSRVREYTPLKAKVIQNGRKKPDELITTLSTVNRARNGDEIYYVEDHTDLEYLSALWNFQLSCRDERGYNYDPSGHATGTITLVSAAADDSVTINGKTYIAKASPSGEGEFSNGGTDAQDAQALADKINADTRIGTEQNIGIMATVSSNVVTVICSVAGTIGNNVTLTETGTTITVSGAGTLTGGTDDDPDASRFTEATANKFQGNYQLDFPDSAGNEITIPNENGKYKTSGGNIVENRIDLSGQFDIIIWFTPDNTPGVGATTDPVLFSRYSSGDNTGLEIGIEEDGVTTNWYPYIRVGDGTSTVKTRGTTAVVMDEGVTNGKPHSIRVCRGEDDIIRMYGDGIEDATDFTEALSLQSSTADIIFGSDAGGTKDFHGSLNQVRVYTGYKLTDGQYSKLHTAKFQPMIMKFGGTIWERKDKTAIKEIKAQSFSKDLNNFKITAESISQPRLDTVSRGNVGALGDSFYTGKHTPYLNKSNTEGFGIGSTGLEIYVINDDSNTIQKWLMTSGTAVDTAEEALDFASGTLTLNSVATGDTATVNGNTYTAVNRAKTDPSEFSNTGNNSENALDLADSINSDPRAGTILSGVTATAAGNVVTITANVAGTGGNSITLAETGTTITKSGTTLTGGGIDEFNVGTQDTQPRDCFIRDNNEWYMVGTSSDKVWYYQMSTSNSIQSSSVQGSGFSVSSQTTAPTGLAVRSGHFYVCSGSTIYEYTCTGADTNTGSYASRSLTVTGETAFRGLWIDLNGDHLYAVGSTNDKVYHWDLSTPWNLDTADLIDTLQIDTEDDEPKGLWLDSAGSTLMVLGGANDQIFKYTLRSNWNLASANRYGAGEMDDIIKDIINNLDPTFLVRTKATMPSQWTGSFLADGTFSELVNLLLVRNNLTFYITPRKVIIIEDQVENGTKQKTSHEFYQLDSVTNTQTAGGVNGDGVHSPYNITSTSDNDQILINEISLIGAKKNDGTNYISNGKIQVEGEKIHSLRINIPQISNQTDLDNLRTSIIGLNNKIEKSYKVISKKDIHHIRPNHLVKLFNADLNITDDVFYKIEYIESLYPESQTIIYVNQFPINFFELAKTETKQVEGLQSESVIPTVVIPPE